MDNAKPQRAREGVRRLLGFVRLVLILTLLLFATWLVSRATLPAGLLRGYFSALFSARVGEFTAWKVLAANLLPFLGVQFMNLYRVSERPGGLYVLPIFWLVYGLSLGTNSFVYAGDPVPFSINILWERTGFMELTAYTLGYEATREWALWVQHGLTRVARIEGKRWRPTLEDAGYWAAGIALLALSAAREVA